MMNAQPEPNRFMDHLLFRSLKGDTTASEEAKVREWRQSAPDNESYYRQLGGLLKLTAAAYGPSDEEIGPAPDIHSTTTTRHRRHWLWWLTAGLGTVAASAVLFIFMQASPQSRELLSLGVDEFVTGSSDVATVQLRDGTIVRLAPNSRLRLTGSPGEREVTLDGRAYFAVAKLNGNPFTVKTHVGDAVVLGTRFEADTRGDELRVLVVEGRVALAAAGSRVELGAGEMGRAMEGAVSAPMKVADVQKLLEWTGNFLVFQRTPIEEVAAEIERNFDLSIDIVGRNLAEQTVTAWFNDPTAEDIVRVVCKVLAATCAIDNRKATIDLNQTMP